MTEPKTSTSTSEYATSLNDGLGWYRDKAMILVIGLILILLVGSFVFPTALFLGAPALDRYNSVTRNMERVEVIYKYIREDCQKKRDGGDRTVDCSKL